eukprot:gnl/TRDRNA2_/TRDRNA2_36223_c1_seq1.p1 gnl/TRDRNA2_/TRDRNA2_36223_c1~~gnl/TRDRNA2_/TRDRNA2_36223_c1_seq1.p1  ORF type:complete len:142 (+),score=36.09 gnl/TRDRNA2_/TRDRNA2_36223_c1_seq1:53-478(+)
MGALTCKPTCKPCCNKDADDAVLPSEKIQKTVERDEKADEAKKLGEALNKASSNEFTITIDRSQGGSLGIEVDGEDDGEVLVIAVVEKVGLIADWNAKAPDANKVKEGHCIVQINSAVGNSEALVSECRVNKPLKLRIRKA